MAPKLEWKKVKEIITGRTVLKNLQSLNPKSLKTLRNKHGKNLLHMAAKHASLPISKYLIEIGLDINVKSKKNAHTPLICALVRNDSESKKIVKLLVNSGADMSWTDLAIRSQSHILFHDKKNIAHMLCLALKRQKGGYKAAAQHLLNQGWSFENISYLQDEKFTNYAIKSDSSLDENYKNLENAITEQNVPLVKLYLNKVGNLKRILSWALKKAAFVESPKSCLIIKLLLNKGASIHPFTHNELQPLEEAISFHNFNNTWILLDHNAKLENFLLSRNPWQVFGRFNWAFHIKPASKESIINSLHLVIEHQGVRNSISFLQELAENFLRLDNSIKYLTTEYLMIVAHLTKLDPVCQVDEYFGDSFDWSYYSKCDKELKNIKNAQIEENINLWDLLMKTIDEMIPITGNDSLINKIKAKSFLDTYPYYGKTLQFKVNKALEKKLLIDHSIDVLNKCIPQLGSSLLILEKVVYYLNDPYLLGLEKLEILK